MNIATDLDRQHFCKYDQAIAAMPDVLPFRSNGCRHVAMNLTTGHKIPCADAYMASGYVAGSAVLFPQWRFALRMGDEVVEAFAAHPRFASRLKDPRWQESEESEREAKRQHADLEDRARQAFDAVMSGRHGTSCDTDD